MDFVGNADAAGATNVLVNCLQVSGRWNDLTPDAGEGLGNKTGKFAAALVDAINGAISERLASLKGNEGDLRAPSR